MFNPDLKMLWNIMILKTKGLRIMIDQVCFPVHGTDTMDLIRRALGAEA